MTVLDLIEKLNTLVKSNPEIGKCTITVDDEVDLLAYQSIKQIDVVESIENPCIVVIKLDK